MSIRQIGTIGGAVACLVFCTAATSAAQQPSSSAVQNAGPLVLEPLKNGFIVAPDARITKINGTIETLVGAYGAWVNDERLLVGGAGYWLANGKNGSGFGYGGLVVGWLVRPDRPVSFTVKGLVGAGQLSETVSLTSPLPVFEADMHTDRVDNARPDNDRPDITNPRLRLRGDFVVAEPEADVQLKLAKHLRVNAGAAYRLVNASRGVADQVRGAAGSVSVQFNFGK
jgi:hypothetical protein